MDFLLNVIINVLIVSAAVSRIFCYLQKAFQLIKEFSYENAIHIGVVASLSGKEKKRHYWFTNELFVDLVI